MLSSIQRIVNRFCHSKRCVQVQFENYEKSKATKSRLNTKRGIGELAFQAQTAPNHRIDCPILLNHPSGKQKIISWRQAVWEGLMSFYNRLRSEWDFVLLDWLWSAGSRRVKDLPFGCCAALTRPDPADMIQTSRQSLSAVRIPSPLLDTFFGYCLSNWSW